MKVSFAATCCVLVILPSKAFTQAIAVAGRDGNGRTVVVATDTARDATCVGKAGNKRFVLDKTSNRLLVVSDSEHTVAEVSSVSIDEWARLQARLTQLQAKTAKLVTNDKSFTSEFRTKFTHSPQVKAALPHRAFSVRSQAASASTSLDGVVHLNNALASAKTRLIDSLKDDNVAAAFSCLVDASHVPFEASLGKSAAISFVAQNSGKSDQWLTYKTVPLWREFPNSAYGAMLTRAAE